MEKTAWRNIPSIGNLSVDWDYEPENPLGKRASARLSDKDLFPLLNVDAIKVQVATSEFNTRGILADLSQNGAAVYLQKKINPGTVIKLGMFLGRHKFIARGIVRNVSATEEGFRVGIEFTGVNEDDRTFIEGLHSSVSYKY